MSWNIIFVYRSTERHDNKMDNNSGKLTISKTYGADVQIYYKDNGDITYFACYLDYSNLDKDGKPRRKRLKIGNKSEGITQAYVKAKKDELATKSRLGEVPKCILSSRRKETVTLNDVAEKYYENRIQKFNLSPDNPNIKNDRSIFKCHLQIFAYRNPNELQDEEIIELINAKRNSGLADSTVNNIITQLKAILNFGIRAKLISQIPIINKITIKDNKRERFFDEDDIRLIHDHLKHNPVLDLFVKISLTTGGRLDSIRHIKVKDINLRTNSITLTDRKKEAANKGDARYSGFFNNNVKSIITAHIKNKRPDDFLFAYPNGEQISKDYIQNNLQRLFNELFNQDLASNDRKNRAVIHTLRHTFASHLAINGVAMYKIQKLMNHSEEKMTARYAKLAPDFGLDEINKLSFL